MVDARRLIVLPNGVDVETWKPDASVRTALRRELGLEDEFLWIAVGRLEPVKDYPALLRAFAHLPESARLIIAGSGPLQDELLQLSTRLGLEKRVRFLGFQADVLRWLQVADAFVLCSLWEGLPMSLLEAAACALPAVATDIPGIGEVLVDGQTGLLAPVGDIEILAAKMRALMQTPLQKRAEMGLRARQSVVERFSLEAILDRWEAEYRNRLARNPQPSRWASPN
jgi:glycosyltransferase involved in cell wall biosynthesis